MPASADFYVLRLGFAMPEDGCGISVGWNPAVDSSFNFWGAGDQIHETNGVDYVKSDNEFTEYYSASGVCCAYFGTYGTNKFDSCLGDPYYPCRDPPGGERVDAYNDCCDAIMPREEWNNDFWHQYQCARASLGLQVSGPLLQALLKWNFVYE